MVLIQRHIDIFRVHLALFTEKATYESTCCYPWMHLGFHTVGWGHFASKWCWSITFLQSYKCCRKARSSSPGKKFVHLIAAALPCHHWLLVWSKIYHMDPIFTPRHMFISINLASFAWDFVNPLLLNSIHQSSYTRPLCINMWKKILVGCRNLFLAILLFYKYRCSFCLVYFHERKTSKTICLTSFFLLIRVAS